jgi:sugar phosphate permease
MGFVAISLTTSLSIMIAVLLIPIGFGGMAIGPLTTSALTSRWFYRRRGRALGIATVATSGGGIVVAPLVGWGIAEFGWRAALFAEAIAISAIVVCLSFLVIRSGPAELGLETHPENRGRPQSDIPFAHHASTVGRAPRQWAYRDILASPNFWTIGFVLAAVTGIAQALVVTFVPFGSQLGLASAAAISLISVFSLTAAVVKVLSGFIAEFVERRIIMLVSAAAMIASLALLLTTTNYAVLLLACALAGTSLGCALPSSAALVASYFGAPSFGRVMGMLYIAVVLSSVVSVAFTGTIFDRTGAYAPAFEAFLWIAIVSSAAAFAIRAPQSGQAAEALSTEAANIVVNRSPR